MHRGAGGDSLTADAEPASPPSEPEPAPPPSEAADEILPEEAEEEAPEGEVEPPFVAAAKFGTFGGVFVPTLLTILGVIMFLRLGWVVGNAGLVWGMSIILLSFAITLATGLSMASIVTNIRVGAGGAYSLISRSLGIEVGGSIGVPLYISQALAVSMYVFGFREGWRYVFPQHPAILVDFGVFAVLFLIALVSSSLAFRVQYLILAVIAASLGSVAWAAATGSMTEPVQWVGTFPGSPETGFLGTDYWTVFAVFFPAATGIMAGANMSGDLKDPRKSIPKGTVAAILVSLVIYVGLAYWLARSASAAELVSNYTIMIDLAAWGPAVVAGLLGATFSSALASLVGAPRILEALGVHRIIPGGDWLSQRSASGEPTRALLVSGVLVVGALMLRSLNAVAPLITMFFLITYAMINVVVLVEQRLNLVSFRPLLRIHWSIPLFGAVGCVAAMFIIAPTFGLVSVVLVVGLYAYLVSQNLTPPYGDVRSGLFYAVSEWAAKHVSALGGAQDRAWKPNLLVPAEDEGDVRRNFHFLRNLSHPKGMLRLLGVARPGGAEALEEPLENLRHAFAEEGLFARSSTLESSSYADGVAGALQALRETLFRPNVLFLPFPTTAEERATTDHLLDEAQRNGLGSLVFREHARTGLGRRDRINVWLPRPEQGWGVDLEELGNVDLALLTAVKLQANWDANVRLVATVDDPTEEELAETFLTALSSLARLPGTPVVLEGEPAGELASAPEADLQIVPLTEGADWERLDEAAEAARTSVVFARDGGDENALA